MKTLMTFGFVLITAVSALAQAAPAADGSDQVKILVRSLRVNGNLVYSEPELIEIARRTGIGVPTVRTYLRRIFAKLGIERRSALAAQRPAAAQAGVAPQTLSLEQAIELARENNPGFLQQRNDVDVARSSVRSAYGSLLPSVNASTGFG